MDTGCLQSCDHQTQYDVKKGVSGGVCRHSQSNNKDCVLKSSCDIAFVFPHSYYIFYKFKDK